MKKFKKWIRCLALVAILLAPLSACNTMEGLGRDTKAAGDALTGAAKDNKGY
ncbi:MAG: entericidin A/B family lipoprotein [Alphaproteobacteria bacterium]